MKKVLIIGAGPGGLAAGMIMSAKGYDVHIYEKDQTIGGRMKPLDLGGYTFDTGPTFLMYIDALKEIFTLAERDLEDYVKLYKLDPMYELFFNEKTLKPSSDRHKMRKIMEDTYPGHVINYFDFLDKQETKFEAVSPILKMPFHKKRYYLKPHMLKALPYLGRRKSVGKLLKKRFVDDDLVNAMSLQTKYLGMSPWKAPGLYTMMSYLEHVKGLYHVEGGLNKLNTAMAKIITEYGGTIHLNKPVKRIITRQGKAYGIQFDDDTVDMAKIIINNSDFAYFGKHLVNAQDQRTYTTKKIDKLDYSISTFMLYLALDKTYQLEHHTIIFADDYKQSLKQMTQKNDLSDDMTLYLHNPSRLDKTLTKKKNHSAMTVLVPVPNNKAQIDWDNERNAFVETILKRIEAKTHITDLREHIVKKKIITPNDWEYAYNVNLGAVFSLSHSLNQMFYHRPHNKYQDIENLYLVGGGTHPGSGLPAIYQSALITTKLITNT